MDFILEALQFLGILCLVVIVFNVLIIVHEWGHYAAARWRGLKIEKFQIWFGKRLWSKEIDGVEFGLGSIPAGGFVALPQMAPMEMLEGSHDDGEPLQPISPLDKIIVAFAGPLFSFGLAAVFATVVYFVGHPVSQASNSTVIGVVGTGTPAEKAGLLPGDNILEVAGKPVKTFQGMVDSVTWNIISSEGEEIPFVVDRPGKGVVKLTVTKEAKDAGAEAEEDKGLWGDFLAMFKRPELRKVGIGPESTPIIIKAIREYSPASEAGLKEGDTLLSMNGEKLYNPGALEQYCSEHEGEAVTLTVLREGAPLNIKVTPRMPDKPGTIKEATLGIKQYGTEPGNGKGAGTILQHPPVHLQLINTLRTMGNTIGAVASPKSDIDIRHLSGPVGIMDLYYRLFKSPDGWRLVLWFSVLLNVNLAVLNMLPLPVLDGGHITMAVIEGVFRRRINIKFLEVVQTACALLLISFMLFVTLFDGGDILRRNQPREEFVEPEFLPREQSAGEMAPWSRIVDFSGIGSRRDA